MANISSSPICSICDKPVTLETSKTDELGKAQPQISGSAISGMKRVGSVEKNEGAKDYV